MNYTSIIVAMNICRLSFVVALSAKQPSDALLMQFLGRLLPTPETLPHPSLSFPPVDIFVSTCLTCEDVRPNAHQSLSRQAISSLSQGQFPRQD